MLTEYSNLEDLTEWVRGYEYVEEVEDSTVDNHYLLRAVTSQPIKDKYMESIQKDLELYNPEVSAESKNELKILVPKNLVSKK